MKSSLPAIVDPTVVSVALTLQFPLSVMEGVKMVLTSEAKETTLGLETDGSLGLETDGGPP